MMILQWHRPANRWQHPYIHMQTGGINCERRRGNKIEVVEEKNRLTFGPQSYVLQRGAVPHQG